MYNIIKTQAVYIKLSKIFMRKNNKVYNKKYG